MWRNPDPRGRKAPHISEKRGESPQPADRSPEGEKVDCQVFSILPKFDQPGKLDQAGIGKQQQPYFASRVELRNDYGRCTKKIAHPLENPIKDLFWSLLN